MEPVVLVAVAGALGVLAGGLLTVYARDPRSTVLASALALVFTLLVVAHASGPAPAAFWLVSALLATELLFSGVRHSTSVLAPLPLGGSVEAAFVLLGAGLGCAAAAAVGADGTRAAALAAGGALALAVVPLAAFARDPLRIGLGSEFALLAAALIGVGIAGPPADPVLAVLALSVLAIAAATRGFLAPEAPPGGESRQRSERTSRWGTHGALTLRGRASARDPSAPRDAAPRDPAPRDPAPGDPAQPVGRAGGIG